MVQNTHPAASIQWRSDSSGPFDVVYEGGTLVGGMGIAEGDVGVIDGRIAALGALGSAQAAERVDCRGLHILPGVIDSQVHFREPGAEAKEDLETGARAAAMGGVTCVFEMPNTNPTTTDAAALADKLARAKGRMDVDHAFFVGATAENVEQLPELERLPGAAGVKLFAGSSTGDLLVEDEENIAGIFAAGRRRISIHSEDEARLRERAGLRVENDPSTHPVWRDPEAARLRTEQLIRLAEAARRRIHILHISTADELPLLADAKTYVSCEATPHHLTIDGDEAYARLRTKVQMNPPVRGAAHRDAIFEAVRQGVIDVLGSDHAPHLLEEKAKLYPQSPSGMPGVQTLVPVMLTHVAEGRLSLERFVDLTAHGPQRIFGMAGKGRLMVGWDADLTVVDLKAEREITNEWIASRCGWTPYAGMIAKGWPIGTVVRGKRVMWDGALLQKGGGAPARFQEC